MLRGTSVMIGIAFAAILCVRDPVYAATDPAAACRDAKAKGAGKKAAGLLKAIGKHIKKPDPEKLSSSVSKASSKITKAFSKAEGKGGCETSGDVDAISTRVDIFAAQMRCAVTPNCDGASDDVDPDDSVTTDNENCTPSCEDSVTGLNCPPPPGCDGATTDDVIETRVTSPTDGPVSIAEYEFNTLEQISVEIEAPQASAADPLQILFMLDQSLFGTLDLVRIELVEIFRNGVKVQDCAAAMSTVADPDPCISQRSLVDGDVHITVLTSQASTWTFNQLPFGPVGPEFQVNTYTTGDQGGFLGQGPRVAFDGTGNFVVVWQSYNQEGVGSDYGIFGQRYDGAGAPLGSEFQVNTHTPDDQRGVAVAAAPSGDFVVVWESYGQDGDGNGIFARRYDGSGAPLDTPEFQVNTYTTGDQGGLGPGLAVDTDSAGNFIIVWASEYGDGSDSTVFGRRYDSSGTPLDTPEFQVNTYTTGYQGSYQGDASVAVAASPAGDFVVVWQSREQVAPGSEMDVFGQRYDSTGTPQGGEFQVNTYTTGHQGGRFGGSLDVDMDSSGNFVVVWNSYNDIGTSQDGDYSGIFAQRFSSAGSSQGIEFQVNTYTIGDQGNGGYGGSVSVASDPVGNFVVVWETYAQSETADQEAIFGRRYNSAGVPLSTSEFQVNTYTTAYQHVPAIAADGNQRFVVVWRSFNQDGDGDGVFSQRFATK